MELGHNRGPLSLLYFFKLGGEYKGDVLTILMPFCIPEMFQNLIKKEKDKMVGDRMKNFITYMFRVSVL